VTDGEPLWTAGFKPAQCFSLAHRGATLKRRAELKSAVLAGRMRSYKINNLQVTSRAVL
jgi:hypothetical protein